MKRVLLLIFVVVQFNLLAQENGERTEKAESSSYVHNVGGFAGASGGLGLSYRYFNQKFGIQVATTPIFASDHTYLSLGITALYSINKGRKTQLYGYLGNHYLYSKDEYENYIYNPDTGINSYSYTETSVNEINITGIGLGFEIVAGQRVGFNFQFGYAYYYRGSDDWNTGFDGGTGIYYKF